MSARTEHIELVWDRESAGTAQTEHGSCIRVGPGGEWTPEQLVLVAVASSYMTTFLVLAKSAGLELLGYVSAAEGSFSPDALAPPTFGIRLCVVVGRESQSARVRPLIDRARERSSIVRSLGGSLRVEAEIVVTSPAASP